MSGSVRLTRRGAIGAGSAAGLALWLPDGVREAHAASAKRVPLAGDGTFESGVMSGDPTPRGVTLWTRLGGSEQRAARVQLEVALDRDFRRTVLRQRVPVTAVRDHTAKVRVTGLRPDTRYWYRFRTKTTRSDIGRTQTAPPPDSNRPIRIGYFSCQAYTAGYFGAYRKLIDLDPDVVVCGGDYIYEQDYHDSGYDKARADKTGANKDGFARTQADYREKYRYYRSDADLRELHRLTPLVAQWDDHEVSDNYAGTVDKGVPPGADVAKYGYDRARILAGWRTWHEYMPALRPGGTKGPDRYRTYRSLRYGRSVDLLMLDERAYREVQPAAAAEHSKPRKYLGDAQLAWFKNAAVNSGAHWKIVGNQLMIMPLTIGGVEIVDDSWDGYDVERANLLGHLQAKNVKNVVFLTGDIHTFFAGEVRQNGQSGPPVAVEFVGGSTTSPGASELLPIDPAVGGSVTDLLPLVNPWLSFASTREHGFALLEASPIGLSAEFWASRGVLTRAATLDTYSLAKFGVTPGVARVDQI